MSFSRGMLISGLLGIAGCNSCVRDSPVVRRDSTNRPLHQEEERNTLDKVLVIGVDGMRPDALQKAATPNIDTLIAEGAYSFGTRTGKYTVSGPGWSNILTGVWEEKHGVKDNSFKGANYGLYPTFFTRVEDFKPDSNTQVIASLDWFEKWMLPKADERIYHPFDQEGDKRVAKTGSQLLSQQNVDLMFVYFMGVDEAGHGYGFDPAVPQYITEIEKVDEYVGILIDAMKRRPEYNQERWLTILTSDHGGKGKEHGGVGEEAMKVPLIMHGPAVQKGELVPVPRQVDIAPTVLTYFGIPIRSEWGLDGKVIGLKEKDRN